MTPGQPPLPPVEALETLDDGLLAALGARLADAGYGGQLLSEAEEVAPRQLDAVRLPLVHAWLGRRGGAGSALAGVFGYAAVAPEPPRRGGPSRRP